MLSGNEKVTEMNLSLWATDLAPNQFGFFITGQTQGFVPNPGGSQGNLCLGGAIGRFRKQIQNSGTAGTFSINVDLANMPPLGSAVQPGDIWNFQAWYRDIGNTNNFTDAVSVVFQ